MYTLSLNLFNMDERDREALRRLTRELLHDLDLDGSSILETLMQDGVLSLNDVEQYIDPLDGNREGQVNALLALIKRRCSPDGPDGTLVSLVKALDGDAPHLKDMLLEKKYSCSIEQSFRSKANRPRCTSCRLLLNVHDVKELTGPLQEMGIISANTAQKMESHSGTRKQKLQGLLSYLSKKQKKQASRRDKPRATNIKMVVETMDNAEECGPNHEQTGVCESKKLESSTSVNQRQSGAFKFPGVDVGSMNIMSKFMNVRGYTVDDIDETPLWTPNVNETPPLWTPNEMNCSTDNCRNTSVLEPDTKYLGPNVSEVTPNKCTVNDEDKDDTPLWGSKGKKTHRRKNQMSTGETELKRSTEDKNDFLQSRTHRGISPNCTSVHHMTKAIIANYANNELSHCSIRTDVHMTETRHTTEIIEHHTTNTVLQALADVLQSDYPHLVDFVRKSNPADLTECTCKFSKNPQRFLQEQIRSYSPNLHQKKKIVEANQHLENKRRKKSRDERSRQFSAEHFDASAEESE